jgi:hypothetical protein
MAGGVVANQATEFQRSTVINIDDFDPKVAAIL